MARKKSKHKKFKDSPCLGLEIKKHLQTLSFFSLYFRNISSWNNSIKNRMSIPSIISEIQFSFTQNGIQCTYSTIFVNNTWLTESNDYFNVSVFIDLFHTFISSLFCRSTLMKSHFMINTWNLSRDRAQKIWSGSARELMKQLTFLQNANATAISNWCS